MAKNTDKGRRDTPAADKAKRERGKPGKGHGNPDLTAQNRRIMGKHYAAKYGVRKGRG